MRTIFKSNFIQAILGIILTFSATVGLTQTVYGAATGEGGFSGGNGCVTSGTGKYWDTCHGASWIKYPVNRNNAIQIPSRGSVQGGTLKGCVDDGADYYYRLGLQVFDRSTGSPLAEQAGLVPASKINAYWPIGELASVWGDRAIDVGTAATYFAKTQAAGMNNGLSWPNVSAFCWSSKLEECPATDPYYPTCTPPPVVGSGDAWFYAKSTVHVDAVGDIANSSGGAIEATSDIDTSAGTGDKNVRVYFSTDQATVKVKFWHNIYYHTNSDEYKDDDDKFGDSVSTSWKTDKGSSDVGGVGDSSGTYTRSSEQEPKSNATSSNITGANSGEVTVTLGYGETKTVCQKITYTEKNFTYKSEDIKKTVEKSPAVDSDGDGKNDTEEVHDYYKWTIDSKSGTATSEACATIYRPSDANPDDRASVGNASSKNMYAGEDTTFKWNAIGMTVPTRRLTGWESVVYLTNESSSQNVNGNNRTTGVCNPVYNSNTTNYWCNHFDGSSLSYGPVYDAHYYSPNEFSFVVPDHTASKMCAGFGHSFGYWYGISTDYPTSDYSWAKSSTSDYWKVYDSSCRTIMKKPSVAIWNGSLMTPGGVKTSLSPRYDTQEMNDDGVGGSDKLIAISNGGDRTLYGSWSEHLDVVHDKVKGHTSGSALYKGHQNKLGLCDDNVNLTISNTGCPDNEDKIGSSDILNNSAYPTKLYTFLRDNDKFTETTTPVRRYVLSNSGDVMNVLGNNMTGTTIIKYTGSSALTIDHNITYNSTLSFNTIYDLPQVLIFTDGDINISSDVTRIDAWIIAGGTIDTCAGHSIYNGTAGTTDEATVYGRSGVKTCSKQLVFNGPVRAAGLKLNRTFGSDPLASLDKGNSYNAEFVTNGSNKSTKEAPAEIFNLRADTYLWAYAQAGRYNSSYTESYSRELPPRY